MSVRRKETVASCMRHAAGAQRERCSAAGAGARAGAAVRARAGRRVVTQIAVGPPPRGEFELGGGAKGAFSCSRGMRGRGTTLDSTGGNKGHVARLVARERGSDSEGGGWVNVSSRKEEGSLAQCRC